MDPFAPFPRAPRPARPVSGRAPLARIAALGAPEAVIEEVRRRWGAASAEERARAQEAVAALTDDELRDAIEETEAELAALAAGASYDAELLRAARDALLEAQALSHKTVPQAIRWVDSDRARALAALVAERRRAATEQRATLTGPLEVLLRGPERVRVG